MIIDCVMIDCRWALYRHFVCFLVNTRIQVICPLVNRQAVSSVDLDRGTKSR